jgi:hypothetical protein
MTTFGNLISDVEGILYSFGMQRDKVTTLLNSISSSDVSLSVANARMIDRGFLEIDQELMAVADVDPTSGAVTLHPWGRGQRGTTAAAHSANSRIVASPRFPRSAIASALQKTIQSMYPDLYKVQTDESSVFSAGRVTYPAPSDADGIISLSYELPGPSREWQQLTRWRFNYDANPTDFPTGRSVDVYESVLPGRPLRIAYRGGFGTLSNESDTLASIGAKDRWADLIVYGAAGSLILGMETLRLQGDAVETQERAEGITPTQPTQVARQFLGMFKQRVMEERSLLHRQHPPVLTRQF